MQKILSRTRYRFLISLLVLKTIILIAILGISISPTVNANPHVTINLEQIDSNPTVAIELDKMNVVYAGLRNPVTIAVEGYSNKDVSVKVRGGWSGKWKLDSLGKGRYYLSGGRGVRELTLSVYAKGKLVGSGKYRVRPIPKPKVKIGQLDGSRPCSKGLIRAQRSVFASLGEGFAYSGVKFKVTNYTAVASYKNYKNEQVNSSINVEGSVFAPASHLVDSLKSGDLIIITNVKAIGPGGEKDLDGITIKVQ